MLRPPIRESVNELLILPRPINEISVEALEGIDKAIDRFAAAGIEIPPDSRIHQARQILDDVSRTGLITPKQRGDDLGLRALEVALDYGDIGNVVATRWPASARRELRASLCGDITPTVSGLRASQLQSQAIAFTAFHLAGCAPRHATLKGVPAPDILLENGVSTYGVEVKRPQSKKGILPRFHDGIAQLRGIGVSGGILIDVTDCIRGLSSKEMEYHVRGYALDLYNVAFELDVGPRPGFSDLMVIGCYARTAAIKDETSSGAIVDLRSFATIGILARAKGTLAAHRASWLRSKFEEGQSQLYRTIRERGAMRAT